MKDTEIKKIRTGIQKYQHLRQGLFNTDVSTNGEFQRVFNGFFKMRQRKEAFYTDFYRYMERHKKNGICFADALGFLYNRHGKMELSFVSKMVALVDPSFPIWDSVVASGHFGLKKPYANSKNRLEKTIKKYDEYCELYAAYMQTDEAKEKIELFDYYFPETDISDVKKVDFILWQER